MSIANDTSTASENGSLGCKSRDTVLSITGPGIERRIEHVSTRVGKIGKHADCEVQLDGAAVADIHCVLIRGKAGTIVRDWADGASLNGKPFEDAWLRDGDCLTIDQYEIEILSSSIAQPEGRRAEESTRDESTQQLSSTEEELVPRPDAVNRFHPYRASEVSSRIDVDPRESAMDPFGKNPQIDSREFQQLHDNAAAAVEKLARLQLSSSQQVAKLQDECLTLRRELHQQQRTIAELEADSKDLRTERDQLQARAAEQDGVLRRLKSYEARVAALEGDNEELGRCWQ